MVGFREIVIEDEFQEAFSPEPAAGVTAAIAAVYYNRMHFLAGRRSWRVDDGNIFGETTNAYVLETIAAERFSAHVFAVSDAVLGLEKFIPNIWIANLSNFIQMRGFVALPSAKQNSAGWRTKSAVCFFVESFPSLASLKASSEFQSALPLFPSILP